MVTMMVMVTILDNVVANSNRNESTQIINSKALSLNCELISPLLGYNITIICL